MKLFVILEGVGIKNFVKTAILQNIQPSCEMSEHKISIYEIPDGDAGMITFCLTEDRQLNNYGIITDSLKPWIELAENVIAITIQPQVFHKGHDIDCSDEYLIRGINSQLTHIKELEEPNLITGISAGVITWRQYNNLPSSCYIFYMKQSTIDSITSHPILKLIKNFGINCSDSYTLKTFTDTSNLYM